MILLYSIKKWKFKVELKTFNADGSKKNIRKLIFAQRKKWFESSPNQNHHLYWIRTFIMIPFCVCNFISILGTRESFQVSSDETVVIGALSCVTMS